MSRRRKLTDTTPFDTLRLEGTLFVPELLERAARGEAAHQKEADYAIPKGLKLHDEYGRAYRIAAALWQDFAPQLPRTDLDPARATHAFVLDLLRQCLGFTDLTPLSAPVQIGDRGFPVTAQALGGRLPVIIAPHSLALDDPDPRFAIHGSGARRKSAHQLAQEFLNASRDCLWAIVTNGRSLRLLRDAETLTRPNFLEFDLETILREGEARYADFSALWRIAHASRAGIATAPPADCIWEKWKSEGHAQGLRVREGLRAGVTQALLILGRGFLTHPDNLALRQRLHEGTLTKEDYFQQLLRLIYRSLFLFCAEERDLLHTPPPADTSDIRHSEFLIRHSVARKSYAEGYSLRRLRNRSLRQTAHDSHGDLWLSLRIVFRALASGQPRLALPALGGLFAETQCPDLDSAALANRDLLAAMRQLRWSSASGSLTAIDYRNMGPEELGSVYESLLELVPQLDLPARTFGFAGITDSASTSGNARKTTGSYYTPDSLVQELIKSALDPVIADRLAAQPDRPVEALLSITVCDPSCGSGHFLLAAARRLAEKLAELRAQDGAVRPDDYRHALREVASHCLYGVDSNPMAVELCRVALWLETVDPGKPLGFLNHHIRTGNSLLGTTPDLIAAGLPDDTFTAIEGDDKAACAELKKRNKKEREGFGPLFQQEEQTIRDRLRLAATQIEAMDDSQPAALQQKEVAFTTSETAPEYRHAKLLADLWCAAFVIKKHYPAAEDEAESLPSSISLRGYAADLPSPVAGHLLHTQDELFGHSTPAPAPKAASKKQPRTKNQEQGTPWGITTAHIRDFVQGKLLPADLQTEVEALARQYRFFHWHLAFPQIFDQGGFDCILGNPPWDTLSPDQREFFGEWVSGLRSMAPDAQQAKITALLENRAIAAEWSEHCRYLFALVHFLKDAGVFTLYAPGNLGKGDFNIYRMFVELALKKIKLGGTAGMVVPGGIYGGPNASAIRRFMFDECELLNLFGLSNTQRGWFEKVDISRFGAFAVKRGGRTKLFRAQFGLMTASDLSRAPIEMDADVIRQQDPETLAISEIADTQALTLATKIRSRFPAFGDESAGKPFRHYLRELDMGGDRDLFVQDAQGIPLYEGRMVAPFDYRFKTYISGHGNSSVWEERAFDDPNKQVAPQWRVLLENVPNRVGSRIWRYRLGFRDVAQPRDERSLIATLIPPGSICGDKVPTIDFNQDYEWAYLPWLAVANSFVMDWIARARLSSPKMSFNLVDSLPFPRLPLNDPWVQKVVPLVLNLICTGPEMTAYWNSMASLGFVEPISPGSIPASALLVPSLRASVRARLDASVARDLFGVSKDELMAILDTFPALRRKDERAYGEFRSKRMLLEAYDQPL